MCQAVSRSIKPPSSLHLSPNPLHRSLTIHSTDLHPTPSPHQPIQRLSPSPLKPSSNLRGSSSLYLSPTPSRLSQGFSPNPRCLRRHRPNLSLSPRRWSSPNPFPWTTSRISADTVSSLGICCPPQSLEISCLTACPPNRCPSGRGEWCLM